MAIIIKSRGLTIHDIPGYDDGIDAPFFDADIRWQLDTILIGFFLNIIDKNSLVESQDRSDFAKFYFYPNRPATRAEVFGFVRNIIQTEEIKIPDVISLNEGIIENIKKVSEGYNVVLVDKYDSHY